jgi:diaminopimelate epimerase
MEGSSEGHGISGKRLVESVLRGLDELADRWEALLVEAEATTYTVDMGDIHAVANSDGKLIELTLAASVVTDYSHGELADRMNVAFAALRDEVQEDYRVRYGGGLQ